MCINSVKETCFSQKYQKWIYQVLEMSSSIIVDKSDQFTLPWWNIAQFSHFHGFYQYIQFIQLRKYFVFELLKDNNSQIRMW